MTIVKLSELGVFLYFASPTLHILESYMKIVHIFVKDNC